MAQYSSTQAAKKLGIPFPTLAHYIRVGKIPRPKSFTSGGLTVHVWSDADIERVRQLLPKIANGRKTRYQKLREKQKTPPWPAAPHKKRKPKKK
jgi:predicted DNA-binding transcriptional regulator AlpA